MSTEFNVNPDDFRDSVARLIKARYGNAIVERKVGGKDADIYFTMAYPGGPPLKIAVECKAWSAPLSSSDITQIFGQYGPAFKYRDIDSLWIVALRPIRAEQRETIDAYGIQLKYFTLDSLVNEIIDFLPYLAFLEADFRRDGFDRYYIKARTDRRENLHESVVLPWLAKPNAPPLAIVAEYGAGKTSYAKFLASQLARRSIGDVTSPKPVLLSLGNLTKQQSVRGLINSLFSDEHNVEGYNFSLFRMLVEWGFFVLIFDGFDEMKHAMKRRDIVANFNSIREFMRGTRSKYLILGRPDPFTSLEDEFAIRGLVGVGTQIVRDATQDEFSIVGLDQFSDREVARFLIGLLKGAPPSHQLNYISAKARVRELQGKQIQHLIRKPVHAKMVGILLASPNWRIEGSTEYDLYRHFVVEFVRRELTEKEARAAIPDTARLEFMNRIAWWLWTQTKSVSFNVDEIPDSVLEHFRKYFDERDTREVLLREMLVGSILGRRMRSDLVIEKDAFSFYFPHRSYWEFLVAEYVASPIFDERDFDMLLDAISPQVVKFLRERNDRAFVSPILRYIASSKGPIELQALVELCKAIRWPCDDASVDEYSRLKLNCVAALARQMPFAEFMQRVQGELTSFEWHRNRSYLEDDTIQRQLNWLTRAALLASIFFYFGDTTNEEREIARAHTIQLHSQLIVAIIEACGAQQVQNVLETSGRAISAPRRVPDAAISYFNNVFTFPWKSRTREIGFDIAALLTASETILGIAVQQRAQTDEVLQLSVSTFLTNVATGQNEEAVETLTRMFDSPKLTIIQGHMGNI